MRDRRRSATAFLEFAAGCDADCLFCLRNARRGARSSSFDRKPLAKFLEAGRDLGLSRVALGGDEPAVVGAGALAGVVRLCKAKGYRDVQLATNGIALGRDGSLELLLRAGVDLFALPLYGACAATHDAVTQRPGSFEAVARAAAGARRGGAAVALHTVLLRRNEGELAAMRRLAARWGAPLEVAALRRDEDHVDYGPLVPKSSPARPAPRIDPFSEGESFLRYQVAAGEVQWRIQTAFFLARALTRLGAPEDLVERLLQSYPRKRWLKDPVRLAELAKRAAAGDFEGPAWDLAACESAAQALRLALGLAKSGRRAEAAAALDATAELAAAGEEDRRVLEKASRLRRALA